jgi:hypothetical protein
LIKATYANAVSKLDTIDNNVFPYDVPLLGTGTVPGYIIAGNSQSGKTTLRKIVQGVLTTMDPEGIRPPTFPLSDGLRGVTYDMLTLNKVDLTCDDIGAAALSGMVDQYALSMERDRQFDNRVFEHYNEPLDESLLRNPAVDAAVAAVSEHPFIHVGVFDVAGMYLSTLMQNGDMTPRALVVDGRNSDELAALLERGGLTLGGLMVMTCKEEDTVRRRMKIEEPDASEDQIIEAIERQKVRNAMDRNRDKRYGPTTMPEDIDNVFELHLQDTAGMATDEVMWPLYVRGIFLSRSIRNAVHIATDNEYGFTVKKEREYVPPIIHGMTAGAQRLNR